MHRHFKFHLFLRKARPNESVEFNSARPAEYSAVDLMVYAGHYELYKAASGVATIYLVGSPQSMICYTIG